MRKAIPLPFAWKAPEEVPLPDDDGEEHDEELGQDNEDPDQDESDDDLNDSTEQLHTPVRRNLVSDTEFLPPVFPEFLSFPGSIHDSSNTCQ
jgi:hypothetical protein